MDDQAELSADLDRHLREVLSAELAENLLPVTEFRLAPGRVVALLPNPVWGDVFRDHAAEIVRAWLVPSGLALHQVVVRDAPASVRRGQRFSDFLQDPGNQLALAACRRVVDAPGLEHNPLYLHGPAGTGKSHLLAAVAAEFGDMVAADAVVRIDGTEFVAREAQQLADGAASELKARLDQAALICFDRIEALAGRALAQEVLFSLINEALDRGTQMVFAGHRPPQRLDDFAERVTSRLAWGLAVPLEVPQSETRSAVLAQLIGPLAEVLGAAELTQLVDHFAPDMHQVAKLAERLLAGERPSARSELASFDRIVRVVADHYGLRPADIAGQRRLRAVAHARQVALLLGRRLTSHSLVALGGMVGGRDHSTVLYGIRMVEERLEKDEDFVREIADLTRQVLGRAVADGEVAMR